MADFNLDDLLGAIRESAYADELDTNEPVVTETGVIVGKVEALPGRDKPVLRDSTTHMKLKGSGQYPSNKGPKQTLPAVQPQAYRETAEYRQRFEELLPAGGDVNERGSMAWWFDQAWAAAEGSPQWIECPHPEYHTEREHRGEPLRHLIVLKKDGALIFKMLELAVGKAVQTQNVNVKEDRLVRILEQRTVDVRIHGITDEEVNERDEVLEAYGYGDAVESSFVGATAAGERGASGASSDADRDIEGGNG